MMPGGSSTLSAFQHTKRMLSAITRLLQIWPLSILPKWISNVGDVRTQLFGPPWSLVHSITVDDRVRGGNSMSYFKEGRFHGSLDTTTLGGAGFASQTLISKSLTYPANLLQYDGIKIELHSSSDEMIYALNIKNEPTLDRGDGRNKSSVEFKVLFSPKDGMVHFFPWTAFKPYYRGRPMETGHLDPERIHSFNIMCQSLFDKQSGPFDVTISQISAVNKSHPCSML